MNETLTRLDKIVNWNSGEQLCQCLAFAVGTDQSGFILSQVCVMDNASQDAPVKGIEQYRLPVRVIRNDQHDSFAVACNQGAKGSRADYLLFLNPDVKLFTNSLTVPNAFMDRPKNKEVEICGIQLVDEKECVARTYARFPTSGCFFAKMLGLDKLFPMVSPSYFMKEWDHSETRIVDHVVGAFFLMRHLVFENLGGFDEQFFVYLEELDFSYRAYRAGWKSVYLATAQSYHKDSGTSEQIKTRRLFYSLRSCIFYGYKHFSLFSVTFVMLGTILIKSFSRLVLAEVRRSSQEAIQTVQAHGLLFCALPAILRNVWQERARAKKQ